MRWKCGECLNHLKLVDIFFFTSGSQKLHSRVEKFSNENLEIWFAINVRKTKVIKQRWWEEKNWKCSESELA